MNNACNCPLKRSQKSLRPKLVPILPGVSGVGNNAVSKSKADVKGNLVVAKRNYFSRQPFLFSVWRMLHSVYSSRLLFLCLYVQFMGDFVNAIRDYQAAVKTDPSYALAYYNAANVYFRQRLFQQVSLINN